MNSAKSVWLGWGTLMVAGGTAYYFAKKDINAYRREQELKGNRGTEFLEWWQIVDRNEATKAASEADVKAKADERKSQNVRTNTKRRTHDDKLG